MQPRHRERVHQPFPPRSDPSPDRHAPEHRTLTAMHPPDKLLINSLRYSAALLVVEADADGLALADELAGYAEWLETQAPPSAGVQSVPRPSKKALSLCNTLSTATLHRLASPHRSWAHLRRSFRNTPALHQAGYTLRDAVDLASAATHLIEQRRGKPRRLPRSPEAGTSRPASLDNPT